MFNIALIRRKHTKIGDVLQDGSVTMAQEVPGLVVAFVIHENRRSYLGIAIIDDDYIYIRDDEEVREHKHSQKQRQASDPESTTHEACPLSVHKNGGAR